MTPEELERRIEAQYTQAYKGLEKKMKVKLKGFDERIKQLKDSGADEKEIQRVARNMLVYEKQARTNIEELAKRAMQADKIAIDYINNAMPQIFADGYNSSMDNVVDLLNGKYQYSPINEQTVKRLLKDEPKLLPQSKLNIPADMAWNKRHIQEQLLQGILQGESAQQIAKRMRTVVGMDRNAAIRNARTAYTGAENAGRNESFNELSKDAEKYGIKVRKQWLATEDSRTRDSHAELNGTYANEKTGKFANGLRYPADPLGAPEEIYNCRCTLVQEVIIK